MREHLLQRCRQPCQLLGEVSQVITGASIYQLTPTPAQLVSQAVQ
jgi:hypothetical protein